MKEKKNQAHQWVTYSEVTDSCFCRASCSAFELPSLIKFILALVPIIQGSCSTAVNVDKWSRLGIPAVSRSPPHHRWFAPHHRSLHYHPTLILPSPPATQQHYKSSISVSSLSCYSSLSNCSSIF